MLRLIDKLTHLFEVRVCGYLTGILMRSSSTINKISGNSELCATDLLDNQLNRQGICHVMPRICLGNLGTLISTKL